jgi:5-methylcytosine-specific restriction endonuclease McrA
MKLWNSTLNTESKKHREMRLAGLLPKKTYKIARTSKKSASLWAKARKECLESYGHRCFLCGATGVIHVHHIILRSLAPELKYDQDNLVCLCEKCHSHHGYDSEYIKLTQKIIAKGLGEKYNLKIDGNKLYFLYKDSK